MHINLLQFQSKLDNDINPSWFFNLTTYIILGVRLPPLSVSNCMLIHVEGRNLAAEKSEIYQCEYFCSSSVPLFTVRWKCSNDFCNMDITSVYKIRWMRWIFSIFLYIDPHSQLDTGIPTVYTSLAPGKWNGGQCDWYSCQTKTHILHFTMS